MRLSIRSQLMLTTMGVAVITVLLGAASLWQYRQIGDKTHEIAKLWLPGVQEVLNLRAQANRLRRAESELYAAPAELIDVKGLTGEIASVRTAMLETEKKLVDLNPGGAGAEVFKAYLAKREAYFAQQQALQADRTSGDPARERHAAEAYFKDHKVKFIGVAETSGKVAKFFAQSSDQANADVAKLQESARTLNLSLMCAAVALAALLSWWRARHLTRALQGAIQTSQAIAQGDLSARVDTRDQSEVGDLMRSLQAMRDQLAGVVGRVRTGAEQVAHASAEISQGNLDLSGRTETQAGALQQTSHSIGQFSASIQQNAHEAAQASRLAQQARDVATNGGSAMNAVVGTMGEISNSSRRIADIIGVIEGIAFQTNILALNAAVEAARAGEQGRGFAVVASEVRTLAQRSATAAKEIKVLIDESVAHVMTGSTQVQAAGQTVTRLVDVIASVTDIVTRIESASATQARDVGQVSDAVQSMDGMTQQNAALVEQASAAAMSLKQQSDTLLQVMQGFKLQAA